MIAGVDSGVMGCVVWGPDWVDLKAVPWDVTFVAKDETEPMRRAVARAEYIAMTYLSRIPRSTAAVGIDLPLYIPRNGSGYTYGPQCALTAVLIHALRIQGLDVVALPGAAARRYAGCKGRGKSGLIAWATTAVLLDGLLDGLPEWKRETIAEAAMLAAAALAVRGQNVEVL